MYVRNMAKQTDLLLWGYIIYKKAHYWLKANLWSKDYGNCKVVESKCSIQVYIWQYRGYTISAS